jgi:hypothetical protein
MTRRVVAKLGDGVGCKGSLDRAGLLTDVGLYALIYAARRRVVLTKLVSKPGV